MNSLAEINITNLNERILVFNQCSIYSFLPVLSTIGITEAYEVGGQSLCLYIFYSSDILTTGPLDLRIFALPFCTFYRTILYLTTMGKNLKD